MKNRYIHHFRFMRVILFTLRIIFLYLAVFSIRYFIPHFLYARLLKRVNAFSSRRIRNYFFKLQGIYIKVGQFLSVMGNIFAPELTRHLKDLQDRVPPRPYSLLRAVFLREWKADPYSLLESFSSVPIASASLSQVYAGKYRGQKVAIKVLYPGIKEIIEKDLQILRSVLNLIEFFFPSLETDNLYNEFADMIFKEVDFNYEKSNLQRLKKLLHQEEKVFIPSYIPELSEGDILVTEFIEGCKIDNVECIKGYQRNPEVVSRQLLEVYLRMIFQYGFFHSDPHPGNLILMPDGKIGIIDYGSAGTILPETIIAIRKLLKAFLFRDISFLVQQLEDMGFLRPSADKEKLENIVYFLIQKLYNFEIKDYQRMTLNEIYKIYNVRALDMKFQELLRFLQIPRHYLFLARTLSILIGVVGKLHPEINIIQVLLPHLKKFLFAKGNNFAQMVKEDLRANFHYLSQLPENIYKMLETVNSGKIKINLKELKKDVKKLYILGHQFIYTLLLITFGSFSVVFHLQKSTGFSKIFSFSSLFFGVILLISFIRNRKY